MELGGINDDSIKEIEKLEEKIKENELKILLSGNHKKIEDWKKRNRPNNESQNTAI